MGVDVVDGVGADPRIGQGHADAGAGAASFRMGVGDPVGIGGGAVAEELAMDLCPAALGMLEFLEHHHRRSLAEDEAVTFIVERPARLRRVVVARRERGEEIEAGDAEGMDHAVGAPRQHHVGLATADKLDRFADCLARGGAGGEAVEVRAIGVEHRGEMPRRHVRLLLHLRQRMERFEADPRELGNVERAPLDRQRHHLREGVKILVHLAAADVHPHPGRVRLEPVGQAGVAHRLERRPGCKARVAAAVLPAFDRLAFVGDRPVADLGGDLRGETRRVEDRRPTDPRGSDLEIGPQILDADAQRRHAADPRDHDAPPVGIVRHAASASCPKYHVDSSCHPPRVPARALPPMRGMGPLTNRAAAAAAPTRRGRCRRYASDRAT